MVQSKDVIHKLFWKNFAKRKEILIQGKPNKDFKKSVFTWFVC